MRIGPITRRSLVGRGGAVVAAVALFAAVAVANAPDRAQTAVVDTSGLATGPYSTMQATLQRTIFNVAVITVVVRFDEPTQEKIAQIARGHSLSPTVANQIAEVTSRSQNAVARVTFHRSVATDRYLSGASQDLARAVKAGMLTAAGYRAAISDLRRAFRPIKSRGFHEGDRLIYRIRPDSLRGVVVSAAGKVLVDTTTSGADRARAVLAAYFAPGATLRDPLIKSIFVATSSEAAPARRACNRRRGGLTVHCAAG